MDGFTASPGLTECTAAAAQGSKRPLARKVKRRVKAFPKPYLSSNDAAIIARLTKASQDKTMEPMITIALRAARKAGENIVRASDDLERFEVRAKGVNNFVSDVDIAAEKEIIYHLNKAYPDHAILGEETGLTGSEDAP